MFSNSTNPFIQARADAVRSILPAAIFRNMTVQPGGLDAAFEKPNGVLDATKKIYVGPLSPPQKQEKLTSVLVDSTSFDDC